MTHKEDLLAWFDRNASVDGPDEEVDDWCFGLPDITEDEIGSILFQRLDRIFATAEGIDELYWEDREQFNFKTALRDEREILARFREAFRRAL